MRHAHRSRPALAAALLGLLMLLGGGPTQAAQPPVQDQAADEVLRAGKALYRRGVNRLGGDVQAQTGASVPLEHGLAACSRCHGHDGIGRREAGLRTPALLWSALSQPREAGGGLAARPAYDEKLLLRALRDGVDAGGQPLAWAMPRFALSPREQADLVGYLRVLGSPADREPGVSAEQVTLATALPLSGPRAAQGQAAQAAIRACIERANRDGGLYGRTLQLLALDSAEQSAGRLAERIDRDALALIAPWWPTASAAELGAALPGVPVIGPLGPSAELDNAPDTIYGIAPQYADQARVLVDEALGNSQLQPSARLTLALLSSDDALHASAARAALRQIDLHDSARLLTWRGSGADATAQAAAGWIHRQDNLDAVLVLAPPDWIEAVAAALAERTQERAPRLLISGNELGRRLLQWPAAWRRQVVVAVANPSANELEPARLFADLAAIGEPRASAPAIQSLAYSASCLSVEALRRTGRHIDRERLRAAIEDIDEFRSGVTHRLSFAPGRRNGLVGSAIAVIDGEPATLRLQGSWRLPRTR